MDFTDNDGSGTSLDFSLNPSFGLDPTQPVRAIPTVSQEVAPETTSQITTPLSTTKLPPGSVQPPLAPKPGQPVDLSPPNPVAVAQPQKPWSPFNANPVFDPNGNPMDYAEAVLKKQADDAAHRAAGPIMKFLDNSWSNSQQQLALEKSMKLKEIQDTKQQQKDMQAKADNMGIPRNQQTWSQTNDTLVENQLKKYKETGDTNAQDALIARGYKPLVDAYRADAMAALESRKNQGQEIQTKLDAAKTDLDYQKVVKDIGDNNYGFKIPKTRAEWDVQHAQIDESRRRANIMLERYKQERADQTDYTTQTDKNLAEAQVNSTKMYNGEVMPGTTAKTHLGSGSHGTAGPHGSNDFTKFGDDKSPDGWNFETEAVLENLRKAQENAFPKSEREKAISFNRIYEGATHDKNGNLLPKGQVNTNPNMQQGIAEGLASILRGGAGGANSQLMKLELAKRGFAQNTIDTLVANFAGLKGVLTGKEGQYLSKLSQGQVREVMDFIKVYNDKDIATRLQGVAERAGMHGIALDKIGLEKELQDGAAPYHAYGRDKSKYYMSTLPRVVRDHDSVFLEPGKSSETVPGMVKDPLPMSALPGLTGINTSATPGATPGGSKPAAPGGPPSTPGGGGGSTVTPTAPPGGGGPGGGSPPPPLRGNVVASTVYNTAGQTALNLGGGNPVIGGNVARIAASSAQSESSFNPNTLHDPGPDGKPRGQGLFGHNADRLAAMQKSAGQTPTGKPGAPISPEAQSAFYAREMLEAAKTDPFIAATLNNKDATAEDLTRVQMRMEKPQGYVKGKEEQAPSWNARLKNTRALMEGGSVQPATVPYPNATTRQQALANYQAGQRMTPEEKAQSAGLRQQRLDQSTQSGAHIAPAALATAGGVLGSVIPGVGTVAGATAGGTVGGLIEHGFTAPQEQQNARGFTEAGVFGGAKGAVSAFPGLGVVGTGARVAGSAAVPAIQKWWQGGDAEEAFDAGMKGAAEGVFGEAFGRGLGLGHQLWTSLSTAGKSEMLAVAKTLATQEPKIAGASGKMVDNPLWVKAEARAKELHQDPDMLKYNYDQTVKMHGEGKTPANMGEVVTQRPGAVEAAKTGREVLDPVRTQIAEAPKASGAMTMQHDPTSMVGTSAVPAKFKADAETAKNTMINGRNGTTPPNNMKDVWDNHIDARADLLQKEREALAAPPFPGQKEAAKAYRAMADKVREQQQYFAEKFLPPDQSKALMQQLKTGDIRYERAMRAGGEDIIKTIAGGGTKGREAKDAFDALVGNDPQAKRMMQSLVNLHVSSAKQAGKQAASGLGALGTAAALIHFIPGVGTVIGGGIAALKVGQVLRDLMVQRGAGKMATFDKLVQKEMSDKARARYVQGSSALAGPAASQGLNAISGGAEPAPAASP